VRLAAAQLLGLGCRMPAGGGMTERIAHALRRREITARRQLPAAPKLITLREPKSETRAL
jgi:hypothetical protein